MLSIHLAKSGTWALTREWALAWDTTVVVMLPQNNYKTILPVLISTAIPTFPHNISRKLFALI